MAVRPVGNQHCRAPPPRENVDEVLRVAMDYFIK